MLQPATYPELLGKALMLDPDPHLVMVDDDQPWVEGLFMTVIVGVLAGVAQLIGGWLLTASMPPANAVLETLLRALGAGLGPEALVQSEASLRAAWGWFGFVTGYGGGWGRLLLIITTPLLLIIQWALFGAVGHGVARLLGGEGTLNQTLGATGLIVAPQVLLFFKIVPFVAVSGGLLLVWSTLIAYRAVGVAHGLPWDRALLAVLVPPALFALIIGIFYGATAGFLIFGGA
jgi:hypothetical protein